MTLLFCIFHRYTIGIGTHPTNDNILKFDDITVTFISGTTTFENIDLSNIDFPPASNNNPVYFNVQCHSSKGQSKISSSPIFIKTEMEDSVILDGSTTDKDIEYQTSTTVIEGQVFLDSNCPLLSASWTIERVGGDLVQYATPLLLSPSNSFNLYTDQVSLDVEQTYRIHFNAIDSCNKNYELISSGVSIVTERAKPPQIQDGLISNHDMNYQTSITTLSAMWSDTDSGLEPIQYLVAVGTDPRFPSTRTDVVPFTDVGLNTNITFNDLGLVSLDTYYFTVRVFVASGDSADASSNGVTVGYEQAIYPGEITINEFQFDTSSLNLHWTDFQSDLPIRLYEVAIGTVELDEDTLELFCRDRTSDFAGEFSLFGFTSVNLDTSASFMNLNLSHNTTYFVSLRALDQAEKCTTVTTAVGTTIDTSPPVSNDTTLDFVQVGTEASIALNPPSTFAVHVVNSQTIRVFWNEFSDPESGIEYYEVALYLQSVCGDVESISEVVADYRNVGTESDTNFDGVALDVGVAYVAVVRAWNRAGLSSRAYSLPFVVDSLEYFSGDVKDGSSWERDVTFQSNLSTLSATFAHTKQPPLTPNAAINGPCPNSLFYQLFDFTSDNWTTISTANPVQPFSSGLVYSASQVNSSVTGVPGITITAIRDSSVPQDQLLTGGYATQVALGEVGLVAMDIVAAYGSEEFEANTVTSLLLIDGAPLNTIVVFEGDNEEQIAQNAVNYNMVGLQIYRGNTADASERVVLWARSGDPGSVLVSLTHDISHVDLSQSHTFALDFKLEQNEHGLSRYVTLYIDNLLEASLYSIPMLSDNTQMVFHVFNRLGYVPPSVAFNPPQVRAVLGNVSLPTRMGGVCSYGDPFYSRGSPIVEFRAGVGSTPSSDNVMAMKVSTQNYVASIQVHCMMTS